LRSQSFEEYQAEKRAREQAAGPHTTRADEGRKNEIKERGLEALRFIYSNQAWERWIDIGEAMLVITEEAAAVLGVAGWDKDNKPLVKLFNRRWDEYEQRAHNDPTHKPLSKQERAMLRFVMEHPEVGAWRATLPGPNKRRLNHPNAVVNAWKRAQPRPRERAAAQPQSQPHGASAAKPSVDKAAEPRAAEAENTRLKAHIAALESRIRGLEISARHSRFSENGYIMPEKQFTSLRACMHPDNVAFLQAVAKDNPAHQPKVESLIKQFAAAAMTLNEFKDVLVNRAAEDARKRSDAFRASVRWKMNEELRKKDQAKREKAAAKRAAAKAAKGLK
jgi:hypothetical protein